jgi:hypothetical protein
MAQSGADIEALLAAEIGRIRQPELLALISSLKVPVRMEERVWDYGHPGQTFPCWIVLEHPPSDTAIAYCSYGLGPRCPWGLLFLSAHPNMGMDSGWFETLEDAVRDSMAWEDQNSRGSEAQ